MVYQVFVNPDTLAVIRNDNLSRMLEGKALDLPGLPIHVRDHKEEDFNEVWVIFSQNKREKITIPYFAFLGETNAREHFTNMKKGRKTQEWGTSYHEMRDLDDDFTPKFDELQLKRVKI